MKEKYFITSKEREENQTLYKCKVNMLKLSLYIHTHDWHEKKNTYIVVCCTIDSSFWLSKNFLKWRVVL